MKPGSITCEECPYPYPSSYLPLTLYGQDVRMAFMDVLPGSAKLFQERMKVLADTIPNGNGKLHLLPGLGHVPHLEAPEKVLPPLVAFFKEGVK